MPKRRTNQVLTNNITGLIEENGLALDTPRIRDVDPAAGADHGDLRGRGAHQRVVTADPYRRDHFKPDFFNGVDQ